MKNPETFGFGNPQDESIWQLAKPTNPWTPNTDNAWKSVSVKLGASAVSASLLTTAPVKTIAKFTLKKLLLWSAVGASVTAGTVYQVKKYRNQSGQSGQSTTVAKSASNSTHALSTAVTQPSKTPVREPNKQTVSTMAASPKSEKSTIPTIAIAPTNRNTHLSPNSKILQFKQTELQVVTEILSQTYGVTIKIERPQLLHCKLTATFENEPIQNILEIIQETFNMEIVPEKETIWLKGGSCQ